jgi:predicted nucleotidyltransferase
MVILCESLFGSRLYGLETPESDYDYKGIVLPTRDEILLGKTSYHIDKSTNTSAIKNSKEDVDRTYYSLQYFINMACSGETVCLDLLAGSSDKWIHTSEIWEFLVSNRHRFYTKSMKSYIGYVRKQAAKYGSKGSRLGEIERVLNIILKMSDNQTVSEIVLDESDVVKWVDYKDNRYLEICGSKYQDNLKLFHLKDSLRKHYDTYGERSKLAKLNMNVDWKAIGHSLRAGYQARDIYTKGGFEYPLVESKFLLDVKQGKIDFNEVEPMLSALVEEVTMLANKSDYPETVDRTFWDDFVKECHLTRF